MQRLRTFLCCLFSTFLFLFQHFTSVVHYGHPTLPRRMWYAMASLTYLNLCKRIGHLPLTKLDMVRRPAFSNGYATSARQPTRINTVRHTPIETFSNTGLISAVSHPRPNRWYPSPAGGCTCSCKGTKTRCNRDLCDRLCCFGTIHYDRLWSSACKMFRF